MRFRILACTLLVWSTIAAAWGQIQGTPVPDSQKSAERVVFFTGSVMLDDGSAPSDSVLIQRVCDGRTTFETWTDAKGRFAFKVDAGGGDSATGDAAQPAAKSDLNKPYGNATQYSNPITSSLRGCELEAILPGFRSERVSMAIKSTMDDARLGTLLLHPLSRASALTVSVTTLAAPSIARKAYEKGSAAVKAQKWDVASAEFEKAVKAYPKFAIAWYQLGLVRQNRKDTAGAVDAWKQALQSDPKYVRPYENLTAQADHSGDWSASETYSRAWIQLDPEDFPAAYLFNAVANARLNNLEQAERAAREGLRIDKDHRVPRLNYVLGLILMQKREYSESAKCFHAYLNLAPNANDAAAVREQLPKLEEASATTPKP